MYIWHKTSEFENAASRYRNDAMDCITPTGCIVSLGIPKVYTRPDGVLMAVYSDSRFLQPRPGPEYLQLAHGEDIPDDWVEQIPDEYDID